MTSFHVILTPQQILRRFCYANVSGKRPTQLSGCVSIEAGSKPGTHFDTKGWKQLIAEFTKATGKEYNRKQLRNKWDQLKVDWKNWKQLKGNETGLGWDSAKKTIDASEEWWAKKLAVISKAKKFRKEGIYPDFEATLDRMFQRTAATGEDAWTPSSRIVPSSIEKDTQLEDSEDSDIEPESSVINIKRKRKNFTNANTYKKAKKVGGAQKLSHQIDRLCEAVERRSSNKNDTLGPSITQAIEELDAIPDIDPLGQIYMFATRLFLDKDKRELFVALKHKEVKIAWLMNEKNVQEEKENNLFTKLF
ncbi:hypothetical protein AHAS_Ahas13G0496100 [Arachis hypogaea]